MCVEIQRFSPRQSICPLCELSGLAFNWRDEIYKVRFQTESDLHGALFWFLKSLGPILEKIPSSKFYRLSIARLNPS